MTKSREMARKKGKNAEPMNCVECKATKGPKEFSKNQRKKRDQAVCRSCAQLDFQKLKNPKLDNETSDEHLARLAKAKEESSAQRAASRQQKKRARKENHEQKDAKRQKPERKCRAQVGGEEVKVKPSNEIIQ